MINDFQRLQKVFRQPDFSKEKVQEPAFMTGNVLREKHNQDPLHQSKHRDPPQRV